MTGKCKLKSIPKRQDGLPRTEWFWPPKAKRREFGFEILHVSTLPCPGAPCSKVGTGIKAGIVWNTHPNTLKWVNSRMKGR